MPAMNASTPPPRGVLLHPTSLPSYGGVGDFGPAAYAFVDFLLAASKATPLAGSSSQPHWPVQLALLRALRLRRQPYPHLGLERLVDAGWL